MFVGQHIGGKDKQKRHNMSLPYREAMGSTATVLKWHDHLRFFKTGDFDKITGFLQKRLSFDSEQGIRSFFDPKLQQDRRHFFGNMHEVSIDSAGRVLIPRELTESIGLGEEVVWVGCGEYLECWPKHQYETQRALWEKAGGFEQLMFGRQLDPDAGSERGPGSGDGGSGAH